MEKVNFFDCASDPSKAKKEGKKRCARFVPKILEISEKKRKIRMLWQEKKVMIGLFLLSSSAPYRNNELD